jgi:hypothetical protein
LNRMSSGGPSFSGSEALNQISGFHRSMGLPNMKASSPNSPRYAESAWKVRSIVRSSVKVRNSYHFIANLACGGCLDYRLLNSLASQDHGEGRRWRCDGVSSHDHDWQLGLAPSEEPGRIRITNMASCRLFSDRMIQLFPAYRQRRMATPGLDKRLVGTRKLACQPLNSSSEMRNLVPARLELNLGQRHLKFGQLT